MEQFGYPYDLRILFYHIIVAFEGFYAKFRQTHIWCKKEAQPCIYQRNCCSPRSNNTNRVWSDCQTCTTPLWRSGPMSPKISMKFMFEYLLSIGGINITK